MGHFARAVPRFRSRIFLYIFFIGKLVHLGVTSEHKVSGFNPMIEYSVMDILMFPNGTLVRSRQFEKDLFVVV